MEQPLWIPGPQQELTLWQMGGQVALTQSGRVNVEGGWGWCPFPYWSPLPLCHGCFQDHSKIASSSLLFSRPWASSLTATQVKEAEFLWGIVLSQEWQLSYLAERAPLRRKRTRARFTFNPLPHHSSALLVHALISPFAQPAGSQELPLPAPVNQHLY